MNDEEITKAATALIGWFESQDIDEMDSITVMLRLVGTVLAARAPTVPDLHEGLSYASDDLKHGALAAHTIKTLQGNS